MEIINNNEQSEQVGSWWFCSAICFGSCWIDPALIAVGFVAYYW